MNRINAIMLLALTLAGCYLQQSPPQPSPQPPSTPAPKGPTVLERVPATADTVGTKGKGYGGGIITEPIRQRFRLENDLLLKVGVQHALELYNATNGRYPASHEEFMKEIVQANNLRLPDLPPGERYIYDPETHTLMVERPKQ